ncbi:hypothetical protein H0H87_006283 [Tephrocybe sp. NHM501043]|nr:hypothetical protein H0H87_006283 [Tephrocybe sp. NHM501043]
MPAHYLILFVPCALILVNYLYGVKKPPLPPAPPADPLIGHLRIAPSSDFHLFFYELGKKYGEQTASRTWSGIMHLNFAGKMMIVLNNVHTAIELLDKRSSIYSDRGPLKVLNIMGWTENLARMRYGKTFHQHRRMFHDNFNKTSVVQFQPIQLREARLLVQNLCEHPEERDKYLGRFAVSIITRIGFGHHVNSDDDPYVALAVETSETLAKAGSGGGVLIEIFPFLQYMPSWFPGTKYVHFAKRQVPRVRELYDFPFREVQAHTAQGTAGTSIMASQLEAHAREGDDVGYNLVDIKGMGATMYVAGVDTVSSGAPHRPMADDIYEGMLIPKGSMVIPNIR